MSDFPPPGSGPNVPPPYGPPGSPQPGGYPPPGYPGYPQPTYPHPGQPQPGGWGYGAPPPPTKTNTLAIAGFVCSLAGCLCSITAPIGLVLSAVALRQIGRSGGTEGGKGLAIAGLVLGILMTLLIIGYIVLLAVGAVSGDFGSSDFD